MIDTIVVPKIVAQPADVPTERRRAGRTNAAPALIGLLRWKSDNAAARKVDPLGPARGVVLGLILALALWAGLFWLLHISLAAA